MDVRFLLRHQNKVTAWNRTLNMNANMLGISENEEGTEVDQVVDTHKLTMLEQ
jgi:hypothetical protein